MEAMWTLFLPRFDVVRQVLEAGLLGDVRTVIADHGEHFDPPHRILDPAMAGGSLLDLGTYVTTLATWALGPALRVLATGETTASGVNGQAAMLLTHANDATSVLHSTLLTRTPTSATIAGTEATLTLPGPFFMPGDVVVTSADGSRAVTWTDPEPFGHGALYHSALEVARCIGDGLLGSPLHTAESVQANMRALDEVTRQLGIATRTRGEERACSFLRRAHLDRVIRRAGPGRPCRGRGAAPRARGPSRRPAGGSRGSRRASASCRACR